MRYPLFLLSGDLFAVVATQLPDAIHVIARALDRLSTGSEEDSGVLHKTIEGD
jgi:hypothetical protein